MPTVLLVDSASKQVTFLQIAKVIQSPDGDVTNVRQSHE